jgi:molybdate transport system permease protein
MFGGLATVSLLFLAGPVVALVGRALGGGAWHALESDVVGAAIWISVWTTAFTVLLTLVFGTPLAYVLARWRFRGRRVVMVFAQLPIVLPPAVAGLALLLALGRRGVAGPLLESAGIAIPFTGAAVVLAQTFVAGPFYVRAAQAGFAGVPREIEDAARVDGAGFWPLFVRVTVPLAGRSLGAGLVLSWARALGEFGATILFAGSLQGRTQTMPLLIYNALERDLDAALATGTLLVMLALVALLLASVLGREWESM